jgi:hypothetical protein
MDRRQCSSSLVLLWHRNNRPQYLWRPHCCKVVVVPRSTVTQPSYASLIHTPKTKGMLMHWTFRMSNYACCVITVTEKKRADLLQCWGKGLHCVLYFRTSWSGFQIRQLRSQRSATQLFRESNSVRQNYFSWNSISCSLYDFPLLLAEIERRPNCLSTQYLVNQSMHFTDTLPHLRQVESSQSLLFMN